MTRLSRRTERKDALDALAFDRRKLPLVITTSRPLAKPRNRKQSRAMRTTASEVAEQIGSQMDQMNRRRFQGSIAVEMLLQLPPRWQEGGLHRTVKAYIDALRGPVVTDDAIVDHLLVMRSAADDDLTHVTLRCLPMSIFTKEFDRAFRIETELPPAAHDGALASAPWGMHRFDEDDQWILSYEERTLALIDDLDAEAEAVALEDPEADHLPELGSVNSELADPEVRDDVRRHLEDSVARARGRKLLDNGVSIFDRPGPPPGWLDEVERHSGSEAARLPDAGLGVFLLPPPPTEPSSPGSVSWDRRIKNSISEAHRTAGPGPLSLEHQLTLDIALRGGAGAHGDIDNYAHQILAAFQDVYRRAANVTPAGYRVYRCDANSTDVRVRLLPRWRLRRLVDMMDAAREEVLTDRASRSRS